MGGKERDRGGSGVWDARHRRLTVGLLLTISITAFEALAVATVLPAAAEDFGGGAALAWYGWVFSAFMLASLIGIPAAGLLSGRGGPSRPFVFGTVLFVAGLVVSGLAPSMPVLVFGRVAQGLGAGALSAIAYLAIARGYDAKDQPRMLALLTTAWVVPGLLGPSAAAVIALQATWRSVFLLLAPATAVAAWFAVAGLRSLEQAAGASDDATAKLWSAFRLAAGTGIVLWGAESQVAITTVGCVLLGGLLAVPALQRLVPPGTLAAAPGAPAALVAKTLVTFAFFGAEAFLPLAVTTVRGESMAVAGLALTAGTLAWTTGTWIQERWVLRVPRAAFILSGVLLVAAAIAASALVVTSPSPAPIAIAAWTVAGLGIGIAYPATTLAVLEDTPEGGEAGAASALQLANVLGVALGTGAGGAVLGLVTAAGRSEAEAVLAIDALMIAVALVAAWAALRSGGAGSLPLRTRVEPAVP